MIEEEVEENFACKLEQMQRQKMFAFNFLPF